VAGVEMPGCLPKTGVGGGIVALGPGQNVHRRRLCPSARISSAKRSALQEAIRYISEQLGLNIFWRGKNNFFF
jgi:hypothetical protein